MKEPTAWINKERDVITFDNLFPEMTPLYEKREWVGLTDEEIYDSYNEPRSDAEMVAFARVLEAKLKEKNG
jgi:hypothetical protein